MCTNPPSGSSPFDTADSKPTLEQLFSPSLSPIQTSLLQNLNFCDYRNLRRAGCHVPAISPAIQKKYLIPIRCSEYKGGARWWDSNADHTCGKHPQEVHDMKPCQGLLLRGDELVEPETVFGHIHEDCYNHDPSDPSKCFWVCNECIDKKRGYLRDEAGLLGDFHTHAQLCQKHTLEHDAKPYNACRCGIVATGDWTCKWCVDGNLDIIKHRLEHAVDLMPCKATLLGILTYVVRPQVDRTDRILELIQEFLLIQEDLNERIPWRVLSKLGFRRRTLQILQYNKLCPIEGCMQVGLNNGRAMSMCLECKTVFPDPYGFSEPRVVNSTARTRRLLWLVLVLTIVFVCWCAPAQRAIKAGAVQLGLVIFTYIR